MEGLQDPCLPLKLPPAAAEMQGGAVRWSVHSNSHGNSPECSICGGHAYKDGAAPPLQHAADLALRQSAARPAEHAVPCGSRCAHAHPAWLETHTLCAAVTLSKLELMLNVVALGYDVVWMDTDMVRARLSVPATQTANKGRAVQCRSLACCLACLAGISPVCIMAITTKTAQHLLARCTSIRQVKHCLHPACFARSLVAP